MTKKNSQKLVGRHAEKKRLHELVLSKRAEFIALYGRRRIGKTFLVEQYLGGLSQTFIHITGQIDADRTRQLEIFQTEIEKKLFDQRRLPPFLTWNVAFQQLISGLKRRISESPKGIITVFLDEIPWLSTQKSGLLSALDHAWNTELRHISNLKLVVCGSAAAWMIKNIVNAKGGLHNRLTASMRLAPFNLQETEEYLHARGIKLSRREIITLYMAFGGVAYYLDFVRRGQSATQAIGTTCFGSGELSSEFDRLFTSLFGDSGDHLKIIRILARRREGLTRDFIVNAMNTSSGGLLSLRLHELIEAGFIDLIVPLGRKIKDAQYRIIDEFVLFALSWIEKAPRGAMIPRDIENYWTAESSTPSYRSWAGYAFENLCFKHQLEIRRALGIAGIATKVGSWRNHPKSKKEKGVQIDLVFARADRCFTICEIKYYDVSFRIEKFYAEALGRKRAEFVKEFAKNKHVFTAMICAHGIDPNEYSRELIDHIVTGDAFFMAKNV